MLTLAQALEFLHLKRKTDEKDEDAAARFTSLQAAFPNDPERVKAEFDAGHTVAEAILELRTKAAADLKAAVDEAVSLKAQLADAQKQIADANKAVADVKADIAARPAVVVPGATDAPADPAAAFKASKDLQAEFGSEEAFLAFTKASMSGRARILQKSKAAE